MSPLIAPDIICLSHNRWDFVYQRPHYLMSHAAEHGRVFFVEEPMPSAQIHLEVQPISDTLFVVVPHMPATLTHLDTATIMQVFLEELLYTYHIHDYMLWYYSPLFVPWTSQLHPHKIVYDCTQEVMVDEQTNERFGDYEMALLAKSDVVFTNDSSLRDHNLRFHPNVHCFPTTIHKGWFAQFRRADTTAAWSATWAAMEAHINALHLQSA